MRTFPVSDVPVPGAPLRALERNVVISSMLHGPVEQLSASESRLVACCDVNALVHAAESAFNEHYPLVLTPDAVWLCLAQGFAHHVALHAETLRRRLVRHQGKIKLVIERGDFLLGRPNPWPEVFAEFSEQIAAHVGKLRDLVVADFTTTGPTERAASEVVLMETFAPYFEYEFMILCGIPAITLMGTPSDWRSIRRRAAMLSEFGLHEWIDALTPVLDRIVEASEGKVDTDFWRSFVRIDSESGRRELTGWINVLFPYLASRNSGSRRRLVRNRHLFGWQDGVERAERRARRSRGLGSKAGGPEPEDIPPGLASVSVHLIDRAGDREHEVRFVAGLFGVIQDETTLALAPEFGWAVVYDTPIPPHE